MLKKFVKISAIIQYLVNYILIRRLLFLLWTIWFFYLVITCLSCFYISFIVKITLQLKSPCCSTAYQCIASLLQNVFNISIWYIFSHTSRENEFINGNPDMWVAAVHSIVIKDFIDCYPILILKHPNLELPWQNQLCWHKLISSFRQNFLVFCSHILAGMIFFQFFSGFPLYVVLYLSLQLLYLASGWVLPLGWSSLR